MPAAPTRYPKASYGLRVLAALIDSLIGGAIMVLVALPLLVASLPRASGTDGRPGATLVPGVLALVAGLAWGLWYGFTKDGMGEGQSYGKRLMGLMVVHTPDDLPCTRGQSAVRALVWTLTGFVPVAGFLIEPVLAILDPDGRRLGDKAADTQVIAAADYGGRLAAGRGSAGALRDPSLDATLDPAMRAALREVDEITRTSPPR